jgi:hypothetical protein
MDTIRNCVIGTSPNDGLARIELANGAIMIITARYKLDSLNEVRELSTALYYGVRIPNTSMIRYSPKERDLALEVWSVLTEIREKKKGSPVYLNYQD